MDDDWGYPCFRKPPYDDNTGYHMLTTMESNSIPYCTV